MDRMIPEKLYFWLGHRADPDWTTWGWIVRRIPREVWERAKREAVENVGETYFAEPPD